MRDAQSIASLERARSPLRHISVGGLIFEQGTPADHIYVVKRGWVGLYQTNPDGNTVILDFALPGDVLPLERHTKTATRSAVALDNVTVCLIHRSRQEQLEREQPAYDALHRAVVGRALDLAEANLATIAFSPARERIAHLLWGLAFRCLHRPPLESDHVRVPISQIQIALATGMSPVHVSRTLRNLREDRMLDFEDHMITIHNRAAVERIAGVFPEGMAI